MGNEGSRPGGGGKKNNFKGRGNTLGTAADAIAARRAREAAQKPQAQARRVVTQKDRDARAAALAAAESRANKFDNRLKKKRQQRKEKSKEKLLERSGSSDGGTAKASFLNQGLAQKLPAQRTVDLGFDPTKSVMSSSSTGRAIQSKIVNGDLRSKDEVSVQGGTGFSQPSLAPAQNILDHNAAGVGGFGSSSGGSQFSSTLANQHQPVDQNALAEVLALTQTSSVALRNKNKPAPEGSSSGINRPTSAQRPAAKASNSGANDPKKQCSAAEIEQALSLFHEAEAMKGDPEMAIAFLYSGTNKYESIRGAETVRKILHNIVSKPSEEKFRNLNVKNAVITRRILLVPGGPQLLASAGFVLDGSDGVSLHERKLVLKDNRPEDILIADISGVVATIDSFLDTSRKDERGARLAAAEKRAKKKFGAQ